MVVRTTKLVPVPSEPTLVDFRRAEAARERELAFAVDLLTAKHQDGMLFERRAYRGIDGIVGGDIGERHAAYFGGKAWTERNDVHGATSMILFLLEFRAKAGRWQGSRTVAATS